MKSNFAAGCILLLALGAASAHAEETDVANDRAADSNDQALNASCSPFLHGRLNGGKASASVTGGWDAATRGARAEAVGWMPVYRRVSLVLGAHLGATET